MKDKITQLPGTKPVESITAIVDRMKTEIPAQIEYFLMKAKMQRAYYLELRKEGFTKEEALELTSKM